MLESILVTKVNEQEKAAGSALQMMNAMHHSRRTNSTCILTCQHPLILHCRYLTCAQATSSYIACSDIASR